MHRHRNHVGEIVQLQGTLVGDDGTRLAQRDPGRDHVLIRAGGEIPQPVEAPVYTLIPAPWTGMMAKGALIHPCRQRLARSEITRLRLGEPVQPVVIYGVRYRNDNTPQTSDESALHSPAGCSGFLRSATDGAQRRMGSDFTRK